MAAVLIAASVVLTMLTVARGTYVPLQLVYALALAVAIFTAETLLNEPWRSRRPDAMRPLHALSVFAFGLDPGPWIVLGAFGATLALEVARRSPPMSAVWMAFRIGALGSIVWWVASASDYPVVGAGLGVLVSFVVAVVCDIAASPGFRELVAEPGQVQRALYNVGVMVSLGMLGGHLLDVHPQWLLALAPVTIAVVREYGAHRAEQAEADLFHTLLAYIRGRDEHGVTPAAELTLVAMESVFSSPATQVTVTVLDAGHSWRLSRAGGGSLVRSAAPSLTAAGTELLALGSGAVISTTSASGAHFGAVLGDPDRPLALVDVLWSAHQTRHRVQRERLGRQVAALATSWLTSAAALERAERAESAAQSATTDVATLVRLSDKTRPALESLREATRQVAFLSHSPATDSAGIVAELDRAALAVATLLGAVTAVGDLPTDVDVAVDAPSQAASGTVSLRPEGPAPSVRFGTMPVVAR